MEKHLETRPGNVLRIDKMDDDHADDLSIGFNEEGDGHPGWGIVLDGEHMMVYAKARQWGYPGAKGESWVSRVVPIAWADPERTEHVQETPPDIPREFWAIAAQAGLNGGV